MNNRKAFIIGLKSLSLSNKEKFFLKKHKPWGIILFSRNLKNFTQIKNLTNSIRSIFNDPKYPILIDQEGGRINRLNKLIETSVFTPEYFGKLYEKDKKLFINRFNIYISQTSYLLSEIGININTVPVLDLRRVKSNKIIGDRSYSSKTNIVSKLGELCIDEYTKKKIGTVIKHIPGHGLAKVDSHKKTPLVKEKLNYLLKNDFVPFKNKKSLFAMTAHIVYRDIDSRNVATHSSKIIKLIRTKIGFKNILISDDISMKALKHSVKINTIKGFSAGCNLILHCNGNYSEMTTVAENSPLIDNFIIKKTSQFYNILS